MPMVLRQTGLINYTNGTRVGGLRMDMRSARDLQKGNSEVRCAVRMLTSTPGICVWRLSLGTGIIGLLTGHLWTKGEMPPGWSLA